MDAIEAVVDLAKDRDELSDILETYEDMLSGLVGKSIILVVGRKNHRRFVECTVTDFNGTEGWQASSDEDDQTYFFTFNEIISGKVQLS